MRMGVIQNDDRFISIASKSKRILIHDDAMRCDVIRFIDILSDCLWRNTILLFS